MKNSKWFTPLVVVFAVLLLTGAGYGSFRILTVGNLTVEGTTSLVGAATTTSDATIGGDLAVTGAADVTGAATIGGAATITGVTTVGSVVYTSSTVSLTSPTVVIDASLLTDNVIINADANLTGIYLTSGTLNQEVTFRSGAGSNTMQYDDGTSMSLGANITLTEGQNDFLTLVCIDSDGDGWAAKSAHDN